MLKLDANENPMPPPPWLLDELADLVADANLRRYPDRTFARLRQAYAAAYDLAADEVSVANGSGEALLHCFSLARQRVRRAVWPWPTFGLYRPLARRIGLAYSEVPTPFAADLDVDAMLAAGAGPALYVLTRPNNPTGYVWSLPAVNALAERMVDGSLLLVDEAYAEFAGESLLHWALARPDVLVVRTLSKAFGLAGVRAGFVAAAAPLAKALEALRLPYTIDVINERLAVRALQHRAEVEAAALTVARWRDHLADALATIPGLELVVGRAPFVLVRHPHWDGPDLQRSLADRGVLVRTYADEPDLRSWIRISACAPEAVPTVVSALRDVMATGAGRRSEPEEVIGR